MTERQLLLGKYLVTHLARAVDGSRILYLQHCYAQSYTVKKGLRKTFAITRHLVLGLLN